MWTVTRQRQWPDGDTVVEISQGGIDYTNPDALGAKYHGEMTEFEDPREAVETAITIAQAWQKDLRRKEPDAIVTIATGATGGMTIPFDGEELSPITFQKLRGWANKALEALPKCGGCGKPITSKPLAMSKEYEYVDADRRFCSEYCLEKVWHDENDPRCTSCDETLDEDNEEGLCSACREKLELQAAVKGRYHLASKIIATTCPYGAYMPYKPSSPDMEFARGMCQCDECYGDRVQWADEQPTLTEMSHPDDLEDVAIEGRQPVMAAKKKRCKCGTDAIEGAKCQNCLSLEPHIKPTAGHAYQLNLREKINWLDRSQLVSLLEGASIQSYDSECDDDLREALATNVEDGTIDESQIDDLVGEKAGRRMGSSEAFLGGVCGQCGKQNRIVNECGCDPNNLPTTVKNAAIWLRLGDMSDYESFDNLSDVADRLKDAGINPESMTLFSSGITADGFKNQNYISLYWGIEGDEDADMTRKLTQAELDEIAGMMMRALP